jgi:TonB family protein
MPRTLLFSSDLEASRRLAQALKELELEVEHCGDIFAAVERLTHESYDAVVADCDDGPEATFLLRTARELRSNKVFFALAVTGGTVNLAPEDIGADLVLTKPIMTEQCKYDLLLCDSFLACLRTWVAGSELATAPESDVRAAANRAPQAPLQKPADQRLAARPAQPSPPPPSAETSPPLNLTFATLDRGLFSSGSRATKANPGDPSERSKPKHGPNKSLWTTAMGVAFLSIGYLSSQPAQVESAGAKAPDAYEQALAGTTSPFPERDNANIRVIPVYRASVQGQVPPSNPETLPVAAQANQPQVAGTAVSVRIPESIKLPQPGADTIRNAAKFTPSLLGELEPVSLSEDSSEPLLLQKVQPSYPEQALRAGLQGAVVLEASIARDGSIRELRLIQGSLLLGQAAYNAVKQWRYKPYLRNGKAVEAQTFVTVDFRLPRQSLLTPRSH